MTTFSRKTETSNKINTYQILQTTQRQRVSNGESMNILMGCESANFLLVIILPQLGDFDSLEYAWWLNRYAREIQAQNIIVRAVGIGNLD